MKKRMKIRKNGMHYVSEEYEDYEEDHEESYEDYESDHEL